MFLIRTDCLRSVTQLSFCVFPPPSSRQVLYLAPVLQRSMCFLSYCLIPLSWGSISSSSILRKSAQKIHFQRSHISENTTPHSVNGKLGRLGTLGSNSFFLGIWKEITSLSNYHPVNVTCHFCPAGFRIFFVSLGFCNVMIL